MERPPTAAAVVIDAESPNSPDAQYCLGAYFRELEDRFETGFDPGQSASPTTDEFVPPGGIFLVMRLSGRPIGCGAFKRIEPHIAYLKRMWIEPSRRGQGLGRRLLQALEDHALRAGYRITRLETNKALPEALQLYKSYGYEEIAAFNDEKYAHHWLEKAL